jgi:hypothetical protein
MIPFHTNSEPSHSPSNEQQVQDTWLRMPNKWHIFKESQTGNNKKDTTRHNAAACLCFLNYLAFLRPAADRADPIIPWVVSRGRSYGFLWAGSIIQKKKEEGQSSSGLFASKRSKTLHGACWSPLWSWSHFLLTPTNLSWNLMIVMSTDNGHCPWIQSLWIVNGYSKNTLGGHRSLHSRMLIMLILMAQLIILDFRHTHSGRIQRLGHQNRLFHMWLTAAKQSGARSVDVSPFCGREDVTLSRSYNRHVIVLAAGLVTSFRTIFDSLRWNSIRICRTCYHLGYTEAMAKVRSEFSDIGQLDAPVLAGCRESSVHQFNIRRAFDMRKAPL